MNLMKLEIGINLEIEKKTRNVKFFLIAAIFDMPAKLAVLNMIGSNGFFGCTKCYQPGISHRESASAGVQHIYEFEPSSGSNWKNKRTTQSYSNDLKEALQNSTMVNGVKGRCILNRLKHFCPVTSTCIDYMYSVLEGVVKNFFNYWFSSKYTNEEYSMRKYMSEINKRIAELRPPKFVPSTPRSIYNYNTWRAHEYLSFLMYYSMAIFKDIMPFNHYQHLKKLIVFLETILAPKINIDYLNKVEPIIIEFVKELTDLYPKSIMLSGAHELLHLTECTLKFGPLNTINCFQFEELNRKLMRFFHGKDLIGEEIIKIFSTAQLLSKYATIVTNTKLKEFISTRICFRSSNRKKNLNKINIQYFNLQTSSDPVKLKVFNKFMLKSLIEISICNRILVNGIIFDSKYIKTKRCDSCFYSLKLQQFGLIECFVIEEKKVYVLAKKIIPLSNSFESTSCPEIRSNLIICNISDEMFIEEINMIRKIVLINISDNNCFVSLFNMSHLFN